MIHNRTVGRLGRTRAGDGHKQHEHDQDGASLAQQVRGRGRRHQPLVRLQIANLRFEICTHRQTVV